MPVKAGTVNPTMLRQAIMNDKEFEYHHDPNSPVIRHFDSPEEVKRFVDAWFDGPQLKYDRTKDLSEKAWDIYNTCEALIDIYYVYPQIVDEVNVCLNGVLTTLNNKLTNVVSRLPKGIF